MRSNASVARAALVGMVIVLSSTRPNNADDWPMRGKDGTRNAVVDYADPPVRWLVDRKVGEQVVSKAQGVRWSVDIGQNSYAAPVISDGLVWIGTSVRRDEASKPDSVLKCFRASDGVQVFEYVSPSLSDRRSDAGWTGLGSAPLIEDGRLYLANNRSEVVCFDISPLILDEGEPKELWKIDCVQLFSTLPRVSIMGPPRPCSIGAAWQDRIFVTLNHGVSEGENEVENPEAPSLICLDKHTGEVLWQDNSPGKNILVTQFASPTLATINGETQVMVPQSDGWIRAFQPQSGKMIWEFDLNDKSAKFSDPSGIGTRDFAVGEAVVDNGQVYVSLGRDVEMCGGPGKIVCIVPTKRGDVSAQLAVDSNGNLLPRRRQQAVIPENGDKVIPNPNSALVWEYTSSGDGFVDVMHRSLCSPSISDGLVMVADFEGAVHCLDAETGKKYWGCDLLSALWASPLIVGDKVYIADEDGVVNIFQLGADPKFASPINTIFHDGPVNSEMAFADGVLYLVSRSTLHAIDCQLVEQSSDGIGHWPTWRGARGDNRSTDTNLLQDWAPAPPPLTWQLDGLGDGIASVTVGYGSLFTTTTKGEAEYAVAIDEVTGQIMWFTEVGAAQPENPLMRWLSQRVPILAGGQVLVFTNSGWLVCLDAEQGRVQWRIHYPSQFGTERGRWGFCDRPLVDGNQLVLFPGGAKATLAAVDLQTGHLIWSVLADKRPQANYASLTIVETAGLKQYVATTMQETISFAADDRRILWRYDGTAEAIGHSYSPFPLQDGVLLMNRSRIAKLKLTRNGDKVDIEEVYKTRWQFSSYDDHLVFDGKSIWGTTSGGALACFDSQLGETTWRESLGTKRAGRATLAYADGRLYVRSHSGTVRIVEARSDRFAECGSFDLTESEVQFGITMHVIAGGALYIRENDRLYKFDVRKHPAGYTPPPPQMIVANPLTDSTRQPFATLPRFDRAIFVPTPEDVVDRMVKVAGLTSDDVLYDLGSGDGRILIAAAKLHGCRTVGIEIDRELVALTQRHVRQQGLEKLVTVQEVSMFETDFSEATVVTAFLPTEMLRSLTPQFEKLKPGSRIVTHQFNIPGKRFEAVQKLTSDETGNEHAVYLYRTPLADEVPK